MNLQNALLIGGAGIGAWWLFTKMGPGAVSAPAVLDDAAMCKFRPDWSPGQCAQRLTELRTAHANAKGQLAQLMARRQAWIAAGDMGQVVATDKAAAPWQTALQQHAQDYWNLTGQVLT